MNRSSQNPHSLLFFPHFRHFARLIISVLLIATSWLAFQAQAFGQEAVLNNFTGAEGGSSTDGANPFTNLVLATDGNFYGTTTYGGYPGNGTVFSITPNGTLNILQKLVPLDGTVPMAGLIQATDGNFYGTTLEQGSALEGTIFKLTPTGTLITLHNFRNGTVTNDGQYCATPLIEGTDGNFYGTTYYGGAASYGVIFKMTPAGTVTILHSFADGTVSNDGKFPLGGLVQASDGNFYGTTQSGGGAYPFFGTVFKMTPTGSVTILHSFTAVGADGYDPEAGLVQGSDGNLYGTTRADGLGYDGTAFKITTSGTLTILHYFGDGSVPHDGALPLAPLMQVADGNFYGTTDVGGSAGYGTVFRLTPGGSVTIFHSFGDGSVANDGANPAAALTLGADGNLYGTTSWGGSGGTGTVFKAAGYNSYTGWASIALAGYSSGDQAPTANPAGDGISNLVKYAFMLDPTGTYTPDAPGLPVVQIQTFSSVDYLTLTYQAIASDLTYTVEATSDLSGTWTTIDTATGAPGSAVTVQDTQPVSSSPARYLRLRVNGDSASGTTDPAGYSYPTVVSAVSSLVQGLAGTWNLPLALTGTVTIEPRRGSTIGTYSVIVTFSDVVSGITATLQLQPGQSGSAVGSAGTPSYDGTNTVVTVPLTGVGDAQRLNLHLSGIMPGNETADIPINILWGDFNGDGTVDVADVDLVKQQSIQTITSSNFQMDINCDGAINIADIGLTKNLSLTSLP